MEKIFIITKAFNAGKTLRRAVESVLAQTYDNFSYHLFDNGSHDDTFEIMSDYERRDTRVSVHKIPPVDVQTFYATRVLDSIHSLDSGDWFATLDADDDYTPVFFEEMLRFAQAKSLDFVACRSNFIEEISGQSQNEYELLQNIVIADVDFGTLFPDYFRFMWARWGKLIQGALLHRVDWAAGIADLARLNLSHRADTAGMLWYLRYSQRAGVLAKLLHNYRQYSGSESKKNIDEKIQDNYKMPDVYRDFLRAKAGFVSIENERFIAEAFERSMRRTLEEKARGTQAAEADRDIESCC
ncbi:MAG: glycosyltransferase family 2 protein [Candidatus Accumulibacter sp.]|nr:glycosyltransferase family 2 protein [Accumulibacter sp.]